MELYTDKERYNLFRKSIGYIEDDSLNSEQSEKSYFRLYFVEQGSGVISINGRNISIISPACLCVNETEKLGVQGLKNYHIHSVFFAPTVVNENLNFNNIRKSTRELNQSEAMDVYWLQTFLNRSQSYNGTLLIGPSTAQRIFGLMKNIGKELSQQTDGFWPCRTRSFLYELLNLLNTIHLHPLQGEHIFTGEKGELINAVIQYLSENYHQTITISDLTNRFYVNRTTLSEHFHKTTGMSIVSYLSRLRVKIACLLLKDTTLPVIEIATRVGFESSTHFGRVFKKQINLSPLQYREETTKIDNL